MHALLMAMLLAGAGNVPSAPSPEPLRMAANAYSPPDMTRFPRPPTPLEPIVTSAPAHLPRAQRPVRRAAATLQYYFNPDDHPAAALRANEEGTVAFRLDVNAAGQVTSCTVTRSSGSAALDAATCRILRGRPHFVPARAADGSAMADSVVGRIRWRLPKDRGRAGRAN